MPSCLLNDIIHIHDVKEQWVLKNSFWKVYRRTKIYTFNKSYLLTYILWSNRNILFNLFCKNPCFSKILFSLIIILLWLFYTQSQVKYPIFYGIFTLISCYFLTLILPQILPKKSCPPCSSWRQLDSSCCWNMIEYDSVISGWVSSVISAWVCSVILEAIRQLLDEPRQQIH